MAAPQHEHDSGRSAGYSVGRGPPSCEAPPPRPEIYGATSGDRMNAIADRITPERRPNRPGRSKALSHLLPKWMEGLPTAGARGFVAEVFSRRHLCSASRRSKMWPKREKFRKAAPHAVETRLSRSRFQ